MQENEKVVPSNENLIRLNLGCGLIAPQGWTNVDASWNARLAKHPFLRRVLSWTGVVPREKSQIPWSSTIFVHDIRNPLPFPDGCASALYASHVLEHLYPKEGRQLIREAFRVLSSAGILRIVVPDLGTIIQEYLGERPFGRLPPELESLRPADRFNQRLLMRWPAPSSSNVFYRIYESWKDFHSHKWMYDRDSLMHLLAETGFVDVQGKKCHESWIEGIQMVEDPSRLLNGAGICVEGVRPARE